MKTINVTLVRSYTSKRGNKTFVYTCSGSAEAIAKYKESMGENLREDEKGNCLWFTTRCIGRNGELVLTTNGNWVPDMSEYDQAASLAAQYGGNLGDALAQAAANKLLGKSTGVVPTTAKQTQDQPEDLDKL